MLGWVISCHDDRAQEMLEGLEKKYGPLAQCRAVNFWRGLSVNMLSRMMCDALHATDSGEGVIFLTDISGAAPYRVAWAVGAVSGGQFLAWVKRKYAQPHDV
ncbi:hypothetical protein ACR29_18725 [Salmonella enterica subsp. enterica serovar Enteritidis]|nr:hypothetical protein [Salmonella enterica subsp. enterica serovar Enteritidis]